MTPASHLWGQVGGVTSAGHLCYDACFGAGVTFRGLSVTRVLAPGGSMGIGNWIQEQLTVKDTAAKAMVLTEPEKAAYQGRGWPGPPTGPQRCSPGNRSSVCLVDEMPLRPQNHCIRLPLRQLTCHPVILTPSKEGLDSGQLPGTLLVSRKTSHTNADLSWFTDGSYSRDENGKYAGHTITTLFKRVSLPLPQQAEL